MAMRKVYEDKLGRYFKGERYKFYHACLPRPGTLVDVDSVCCGQLGASATFFTCGRWFFVPSGVDVSSPGPLRKKSRAK